MRRAICRAAKDRDALVAGLRALRGIVSAPALSPFIEAEHDPGPACASDDDLLDFARRKGSTVYHPTSTCRMGDDATAVVDARLRVRGVANLRVVDASDDAGAGVGQHERRDDHDRREGRGYDFGGFSNLILRSLRGRRLEGWSRTPACTPSPFETREDALLRGEGSQ